MITIVDIHMGNINSVVKALNFLKIKSKVSSDPQEILEAEKIIFPGVGNFSSASKVLIETKIRDCIREAVLTNKTPFLGICLGMQLMLSKGLEGGESKGLDLISGQVSPISDIGGLPIPHMGWNDVSQNSLKSFNNINETDCFYFVHSYEAILTENIKQATTDYGKNIVAAIEKEHIWGTQFHPEKSQKPGLQILKNFQDYL